MYSTKAACTPYRNLYFIPNNMQADLREAHNRCDRNMRSHATCNIPKGVTLLWAQYMQYNPLCTLHSTMVQPLCSYYLSLPAT
mmetsp:Transcript_22917/g.50257  ORF Transcript_22917/g.50257 Transcript_22917/m.50257 type:complete len:83 (+) Transcript_22917:99-347(+)